MIEKLTAAQQARAPEFVKKWTKIGLATGPGNRKEAENAMCVAYVAAGIPVPKRFIWVNGPIEGARLATNALAASSLEDFDKKMDQKPTNTLAGFDARGLGQFDAGWCAHYDFLEEVCGVACVKHLHGLILLAKNTSMWWVFEELAILCDRPSIISCDDAGRVHSQTGPCVEYPGDLKFYAWHGTVVPEAWITKKPTPDEVLTCSNVEMRRAGAEIVGWVNILDKLKARTIDKDSDPMMGELLEVDLPEAPNSRFLRVRCGTGRDFCLPVPSNMKSAVEANAWTYDIDVSIDTFRGYKLRT